MQVNVFDTLGIKDVQSTGPIKSIPNVGKHKAVEYSYGTGCAIALEVTAASRSDVYVASGNDTQRACQIATQVAHMVEPKLPPS